MDAIEIWPEGDFNFGTTQIDGQTYYVVEMAHQRGEPVVRLFFNQQTFVATADHLKMVADAIVSGEFE